MVLLQFSATFKKTFDPNFLPPIELIGLWQVRVHRRFAADRCLAEQIKHQRTTKGSLRLKQEALSSRHQLKRIPSWPSIPALPWASQ